VPQDLKDKIHNFVAFNGNKDTFMNVSPQ